MCILKYLDDISLCLTARRKAGKLVLLNNIFVQLIKSSAGPFFLVFLNRLSATFDIQIDLKMKHP